MANYWPSESIGGALGSVFGGQNSMQDYSRLQGSQLQASTTFVPGSFIPLGGLSQYVLGKSRSCIQEVRESVRRIKEIVTEDLIDDIF